MRGGRF